MRPKLGGISDAGHYMVWHTLPHPTLYGVAHLTTLYGVAHRTTPHIIWCGTPYHTAALLIWMHFLWKIFITPRTILWHQCPMSSIYSPRELASCAKVGTCSEKLSSSPPSYIRFSASNVLIIDLETYPVKIPEALSWIFKRNHFLDLLQLYVTWQNSPNNSDHKN